MLAYGLRRLGASLLLLLLALTATFFLIHVAPGEPAVLFQDPRISFEQRQMLRRFYGLDRPLVEQYGAWMSAVVRGDWGTSISSQRPALELLLEKLPNTCLLVVGTLLVEYGVGLPLGLLAAAYAGRPADHLVRGAALLLLALPVFGLGLLAIELFAVRWPLFPSGQMSSDMARQLGAGARTLDLLHHLVLPALVLGLARAGAVVRYVRNGVLEVLQQDYIRTARAKGLGRARVLWVHALPNAAGPLIQRFGVSLPELLSGSLVIEVVFSWPGIGQANWSAILERDYPVILASTALSAVLVIAGTLLADLLQAWVDPRLRVR